MTAGDGRAGPPAPDSARPAARRIGLLLVPAIAAAIVLTGAGGSPEASRSLALIFLTIGLWATAAIPEHLTALLFFALAMLFAVAPASITFAGFHSGATWLIFGGLVIGVAIHGTGLGAKVANRLAGLFGRTYSGIVVGLAAVGIALSFLMPSSMGRVMLLMPIALALADRYGFAEGSNGRTAIVLSMLLGAFLVPFSILPANVPNIVLLGLSEDIHGVVPTYGQWLAHHFPVLGLAKAAAGVVLILALFPDRPRQAAAAPPPTRLSAPERRLGLILVAALLGWLTDFAHGISPAWIALAAAAACLMPGLGVLAPRDFEKVNFPSVFYVAGILGIGALVAESGWGTRLGQALIDIAPLGPDQPAANFLALVGIGMGVSLVTTVAGMPAVMTPLAGDLAATTGFTLDTVLMLQVLSFSTPILVYQVAPMVVAVQISGIAHRDAAKLLFAMTAVTVLILFPLDFLWLRVLGLF